MSDAAGPFFSVILPTYNRARMAAAAVLSLLGQTDKEFECFVVDDGSTDDTPRVLAALPKDPRVSVLRMERNRGQHVCRNHAIRRASGRFVTFLDSDDLYLPGRLEAFRRAIESRPAAGFWFSNAYVRRFGRIIGRLFDPARDIPEGKVPGYYAVGEEFLPYVTTNVAVRREAFDEFGLYREDLRILEDTELYARMLAGGLEVGAIREPLAVRCLHESQITRDYERDFEEAVLALKAGEPPPEVESPRRRELAAEVAGYLLKNAEPLRARRLLARELGEAAPAHPLYLKTFAPPAALRLMRWARKLYLGARYAPAFAPPELRKAGRLIDPYLDHAARL
ncbi:MAG: glycosyltransferase family 2 protein [Elusimicrobiota bacterium]